MMNICLIGSGNIATFVTTRLKDSVLFQVNEWVTRNIRKCREEAAGFGIGVDRIHFLSPGDPIQSSVVLLALPDDQLQNIGREAIFENKTLIHFSGATSNAELGHQDRTACIWPVYSIKKNVLPEHKEIPMVICSADNEAKQLALNIAGYLSDQIRILDEKQKHILHLAAVFVNNFTNHLFHLSENILEKNNISFDLLRPIIVQSVDNLRNQKPSDLQTGPAFSKDEKTLQKHLRLLENDTDIRLVYELLSRSIQNTKD